MYISTYIDDIFFNNSLKVNELFSQKIINFILTRVFSFFVKVKFCIICCYFYIGVGSTLKVTRNRRKNIGKNVNKKTHFFREKKSVNDDVIAFYRLIMIYKVIASI